MAWFKNLFEKNFKSPQWVRDIKFKKYPFWRIDKMRNLQIIENGGWHFAFLQSPENISKKIRSFAHGEFNKAELTDTEKIEEKIKKNQDIFDRGHKLKRVDIDESFPEYIVNNMNNLKNWII